MKYFLSSVAGLVFAAVGLVFAALGLGLGLGFSSPSLYAQASKPAGAAATEKNQVKKMKDGLYARITTPRGEILARLHVEEAPLTVANFVGLAEGTKDYAVPGRSGAKGPFFDGLTFHRVVDDFVVQGGDPLGNGTGGPGYRFRDEVSWQLKHERPGILSMANSGPDSNGSQFFITLKATPWLDGKHSVFGEVVEGMEVVRKIQKGDKMERVVILRVGKKYQSYTVSQSDFEALALSVERALKELRTSKVKNFIDKNWPKAKKTPNGAYYLILREGKGATPKPGQVVSVHYTGRLMDGEMFDDSYSRNQPIKFPVGEGKVIKGWDEALLKMRLGEKRVLILPPELAYGTRAVGPIPPNAYLVFEMELVDF